MPNQGGMWKGVTPAVSTPFTRTGDVDLERLERHCDWLVDNGVGSLIMLGSVGEGGTLRESERAAVLRAAVSGARSRVAVVAAVSGLASHQAVDQARAAKDLGVDGLMLVPPYVYVGDSREVRAHFSYVLGATDLPCMLYNNPSGYGTDVPSSMVLDLASEHANLAAVKESTGDVRRITALRALLGNRLEVAVGVDDLVLEGLAAGASGWVGGLTNALPRESVELFREAGPPASARGKEIYDWFLPLLRMDDDRRFVQLIKLVEQEVGWGPAYVRPPRLELVAESGGNEARDLVRHALNHRPSGLAASSPIRPPALEAAR